jgi:hypothetical protein
MALYCNALFAAISEIRCVDILIMLATGSYTNICHGAFVIFNTGTDGQKPATHKQRPNRIVILFQNSKK